MTRRRALALFGALPTAAVAAETGALHVRVVDETGRQVACSVALRDAAGALVLETRSYTAGFRSTGEFRKELPAGTARLTVTRGFDFIPEQREVAIRPGEMAELEVRLKRRSPLAQLGWRCGDHHVHMTHGESVIRVDFDYLALAARAEGLDYMSVAQFWNIPNPTAVAAEAECRRVSTPDCTVSWNLEAPKNYYRGDASHTLGHCWFVGARATETIAQELLAMSAHDYESEKPPTANFESHALIHEHGGVIAYTHPCRWWTGKWGGVGIYPVEEKKFVSNLAAELPFDTIAGPTYDAMDVLMQTHEKAVNANGQKLWFMLLNHGYRLPATASSDATFDNEGRGTPGRVRIYARGEHADAIRRGRSFITSGPLLLLEVDGRQPGDTIVADGPQRRVAKVRAWGADLSSIELVRNGEVIHSAAISGPEAQMEHSWTEEGGAWVIAHCFGRDRETQLAITNPVFLDRPGWKPPEPARANVRIRVTDARSGQGIGASCEAVEMVGRRARQILRRDVRGGALELEVPATARLRVTAPGYKPLTKSIFLDCEPILQATINSRVEHLLDWSTYERLRRLLLEARLDFPLEKAS